MRSFSRKITLHRMTYKSASTRRRFPNLVPFNFRYDKDIYLPPSVVDSETFEQWISFHVQEDGTYTLMRRQIIRRKGNRWTKPSQFQIKDGKVVFVEPNSWLDKMLKAGDKKKAEEMLEQRIAQGGEIL